MDDKEVADALATVAGLFMLVNFLIFTDELKVVVSGLLVGGVVFVAGAYNVSRVYRGLPGKESINQFSILLGMWMVFLVLFWKTTAHTELVATTGGAIITVTSVYAAFRRQHPLAEGEDSMSFLDASM